MYGIRFSSDSLGPAVQFGLHTEQPFSTLGDAFDLVSMDLHTQGAGLAAGARDAGLDYLTLCDDTLFEVYISAHRGEWLLIVKDFYSGSETSTGARDLAELFAFIIHWHGGAFRSVA